MPWIRNCDSNRWKWFFKFSARGLRVSIFDIWSSRRDQMYFCAYVSMLFWLGQPDLQFMSFSWKKIAINRSSYGLTFSKLNVDAISKLWLKIHQNGALQPRSNHYPITVFLETQKISKICLRSKHEFNKILAHAP